VDVNRDRFVERGRFSLVVIGNPAWVAPVVSDGKLYLRSENWLVCLDLQNAVKAKNAVDGKVSGD
ncbi:MAG: hypothetical protein ACK5MO_20870, partial [Planctomyces sp.]